MNVVSRRPIPGITVDDRLVRLQAGPHRALTKPSTRAAMSDATTSGERVSRERMRRIVTSTIATKKTKPTSGSAGATLAENVPPSSGRACHGGKYDRAAGRKG